MEYNLLHLIQYDPAIATRILSVANLPVYGYGRHVDSLQQAAGLLSPSLVTSIILTTPIFEMFNDSDHTYHQQFNHLQLWAHCGVTGGLAGFLAAKLQLMEEDICLTLGLIHDIGKMALILTYPKAMLEALDQSKVKKIPLSQALEALIGCNQHEVAGQLATDWNFPDNLIDFLKNPEAETESNRDLGGIVLMANALAEDWGYGDGLDVKKTNSVDMLIESLALSPRDLEQWQPEMKRLAEALSRSILTKTLS
jgi:HD-like signal output (HDOD) protein